jgi:exosortase A-associated hydrolase 2
LNGAAITPGFLAGARGQIFALTRRPPARSGHGVLIVPPFAEEMNKSRRMFTDVATGLARRGLATVVPDLFGTGDSEGEFREADWDVWADDLQRVARRSAEEGWPIRAVLCTRLGCMLGAQVARSLPGLTRTVFWQPVLDGDRFLTQFLRLRVAASMMDKDRKETVAQLKEQMRSAQFIEVSGYELSARLASQIESQRLPPALGTHLGVLHWMEVVRDLDAPLPTPHAACIEKAKASGIEVELEKVLGEPFWQSTEIVRIAELTGRTVEALASAGASAA